VIQKIRFLPSVVSAKHRGDFRVHLTYNDEVEATVDFAQWLEGPVFEPLKQPDYFARFFVEGGTGVWPHGADIAPETLYEAALVERHGRRPHPTAAAVREPRGTYKSAPKRRRR
jgi:hypothetical protein